MQETWVQSLGQEGPRRRKWQPTLLPGKQHGQRSLAGYSPWGRKAAAMTEHSTHTHTHTHTHTIMKIFLFFKNILGISKVPLRTGKGGDMLERFFLKLAIIRCTQVRISQGHVLVSVLEQPQVLGEARVSPLQLDIRTKPKTFRSCSPCLALCWVQCSAYSLPLSKSQEAHHCIFSGILISASVL